MVGAFCLLAHFSRLNPCGASQQTDRSGWLTLGASVAIAPWTMGVSYQSQAAGALGLHYKLDMVPLLQPQLGAVVQSQMASAIAGYTSGSPSASARVCPPTVIGPYGIDAEARIE